MDNYFLEICKSLLKNGEMILIKDDRENDHTYLYELGKSEYKKIKNGENISEN